MSIADTLVRVLESPRERRKHEALVARWWPMRLATAAGRGAGYTPTVLRQLAAELTPVSIALELQWEVYFAAGRRDYGPVREGLRARDRINIRYGLAVENDIYGYSAMSVSQPRLPVGWRAH